MEQPRPPNNSVATKPCDWAKLLRKLRWSGMDEEADRLQRVMQSVPPEERGTVSAGPFSTD
jgi:hypothetical protein